MLNGVPHHGALLPCNFIDILPKKRKKGTASLLRAAPQPAAGTVETPRQRFLQPLFLESDRRQAEGALQL
jgi:hypothetical protein